MANAPATLDMTEYLASKSNHLTVEDFIGGPRTLQIRAAQPTGNEDRPVAIFFADEPKAYLPAKTVRRILARIWPEDSKRASATYPGRWLRLYIDPDVSYGTEVTGGIRIDGASHLDAPVTGSLVSGRNKRAPFRVEPISPPVAQQTIRPRPLADILASIPRGEARLDAEALTSLRERFGVAGSPDPTTWAEPLARGYFAALTEAVKS